MLPNPSEFVERWNGNEYYMVDPEKSKYLLEEGGKGRVTICLYKVKCGVNLTRLVEYRAAANNKELGEDQRHDSKSLTSSCDELINCPKLMTPFSPGMIVPTSSNKIVIERNFSLWDGKSHLLKRVLRLTVQLIHISLA